MRWLVWLSAAAAVLGTGTLVAAAEPDPEQVARYAAYKQVVDATAGMVSDPQARLLAMKHGLHVLNVTWEDTGRFYGSSVGPNISDMTIQVQQRDPKMGKYSLTCMPVIRFPNFSDITGDVPLDRFKVLVGNQQGKPLKAVTLRELLGDLRRFLTKPGSWPGDTKSLLADRDTHVLASAQACFLPVPREGGAEFNPVLFNYQSYEGDPAVLTILATREGTSVTVIDNKRDAFQYGATWGQRLFFNQNGQRASLTGKRKSDFQAEHRNKPEKQPAVEAASQSALNMVLLIQVPLKQKRPMRGGGGGMMGGMGGMKWGEMMAPMPKQSDVEEAVIGHGKVEGPFTEIAGLPVRRDPKYPIRVTVQFYKATSNGVVTEKDLGEIAARINRVYKDADYVGSLVVDGPSPRPTEHEGDKVPPPWWWDSFWRRHQKNTGQTPAETLQMLEKLYGPNWRPRSHREMVEAVRRLAKEPAAKTPEAKQEPGADEMPKQVNDALKAKFPKAEIDKCTKEKEGETVVYDIEFKQEGRKFEADIREDGTISNWEKEIAAEDLPGAVKKAVDKKYPKAAMKVVMLVTAVKDGKDVPEGYEVVIETADKKAIEITVSPDGKIVEDSVERK